MRDDRKRQDGRLPAADPAQPHRPAARHDARARADADARTGGADSRGSQRSRRRTRRSPPPPSSGASEWARKSTHSRAASMSSWGRPGASSIISVRPTPSSPASSISCSMRPIACSTWDFFPTSGACSATFRAAGRRSFSAQRSRRRSPRCRARCCAIRSRSIWSGAPRQPSGSPMRCTRCRSISSPRCSSRC